MKKRQFLMGLRDAVPIGLGYFAVSFSLGIACRNAGVTPLQGLVLSLLNNASAGQYAVVRMISASATLAETVLMVLVVNARYLLMSFALSQRVHPKTPLYARFIIGFDVTDELFALAATRPENFTHGYYFGAMCSSIPFWAAGTVLGITVGNVLPANVVSALSVTLFAMFVAIIVPQARRDKKVLLCVAVSFAASYFGRYLPLSEGVRIILMTVVISALAALLFPHREVAE